MIAGWQLEVVDHLLRKVKNCDLPFRGCVVILVRDLRQLPPVVKNSSRAKLLEESIVSSRLWPLFHHVSLTINMRISPGENEWGNFILAYLPVAELYCPCAVGFTAPGALYTTNHDSTILLQADDLLGV